MPVTLMLPDAAGRLREYRMRESRGWAAAPAPFTSRVAFAAAHVVVDPLANGDPVTASAIDWDATMSYRRFLWKQGFAVAEAMDTAQRGGGLSWTRARELIRRSVAESAGARIACGIGTDQIATPASATLDDVLAAYREQCEFVEAVGAQAIVMASRALAACARGPEDYARVYETVLASLSRPAILHWLGDMFDPLLAGYWGSRDTAIAMDVCLDIIAANRSRIDGIKISLLDKDREIHMRRRLPEGVRMYTGDDFHYDELILGDAAGFSHALLGIFDAIAPVAATALRALDSGDHQRFSELLRPTIPLSRHIFQSPTYAYKTGVVFLAYLNGHQRHFRMLGAQEGWRSIPHLSELFMLADAAGLLRDTEMAAHRMRTVLALGGLE